MRYLLFILLTSLLSAEVLQPVLPSVHVDPNTLTYENVHVISGAYIATEQEITVNCHEPIHIGRVYVSSDPANPWDRSQWRIEEQMVHVRIAPRGWLDSIRLVSSMEGTTDFRPVGTWNFDSFRLPGIWDAYPVVAGDYCNTGYGVLSSRNDRRNAVLRFNLSKSQCTLVSPNGEQKVFAQVGAWSGAMDRVMDGENNSWRYGHYRLDHVIRPNGNVISYRYSDDNLLTAITSANSSGNRIYGWAKFSYRVEGDHRITEIETSDGQHYERYEQRKSIYGYGRVRRAWFLTRAASWQGIRDSYGYPYESLFLIQAKRNDVERRKIFYLGEPRIYHPNQNGDRDPNPLPLKIYSNDPRLGRVYRVEAPVGVQGQSQVIASYYPYFARRRDGSFTDQRRTDVYNAFKGMIAFHHSNGRLLKKVRTGVSVHQQEWDARGRLTHDHHGSPKQNLITVAYGYDEIGNVESERHISATLDYVRRFTYDLNNFSVLTSESDGMLDKRYTYVPDTDLLASQEIYEQGILASRTTYYYDDTVLVGVDEESFCGGDVVFIKSTSIGSTRSDQLPEFIEERANGQLVKRLELVYDQAYARVVEKRVFDAQGLYRYSLLTGYDAYGRVVSEGDPEGNQTTYEYDSFGNCIKVASPEGRATDYTYDVMGRCVLERNGEQARHYRYDAMGNKISETDYCGNETRFEYDQFCRCIREIKPDGAVTAREYDAFDRVVKEIDPKEYPTQYEYDSRGQVLCIQHPDGTRETKEYLPDGRLFAETARNGSRTEYTRDYLDRVLETRVIVDDQVIRTTSCKYRGPLLESEVDGAGVVTTYRYDERGQLVEKEKAGCVIRYVYDALGRCVEQQEPYTTTRWQYDLLNRIICEEVEDSLTSYTYDRDGNQIECAVFLDEERANTTKTEYDHLNRPILVTDCEEQETTIVYLYKEVLAQETVDPLGQRVIITHDVNGRPVLVERGDLFQILSRQEIRYDLAGNEIAHIHTVFPSDRTVIAEWKYGPCNRLECLNEKGRRTKYTYNESGQLTCVEKQSGMKIHTTYDALGRVATYWRYRYTYDANDNIICVDGPEGEQTERTYNAFGQLTSERLANGLFVAKDYDAQGRVSQLTLPDHSVVEYTYDASHLRTVSRKGYTHHYLAYDRAGNLLQEELVSGDRVHYVYDQLERLRRIEGPFFTQTVDAFDKAGNIVAITTNGRRAAYTYDKLYQLSSEPEHSYVHDSLFNRIEHNQVSYDFNGLNQLSSATYSPDGYLLAYGEATYAYDELGRLISVADSKKAISYTYDAFNRRLSKEVDGRKTTYFYDEDYEIGAVEDCLIELRVLGIGMGAEIGAAVMVELNDQLLAPMHDYRGSLVALTDEWGGLVHFTTYSAFGEPDSTLPAWGFLSKRTDDTGLIYFGQRYYDPSIGVWLTPDPAGYAEGPNLYAYCFNNPLTQVDWWGLSAQSIHSGSAAQVVSTLFSVLQTIVVKMLGNSVGAACELIGKHVFADAYIGPGLMKIGAALQGQNHPLHYYHPFSNYSPAQSGGGSANIACLFTNGILNGREEAESTAKRLSDYCGVPCSTAYNASHGLVSDLIECVLNFFGIPHRAVDVNVKAIRAELQRVGPGGTCVLLAHSQGGMVTHLALQCLSKEERSRIEVYTFGSPIWIENGRAKKVMNFASTNDFCSSLANVRSSCMKAAHGYTVKWFKPTSRVPGGDHPFRKGHYEWAATMVVGGARQRLSV